MKRLLRASLLLSLGALLFAVGAFSHGEKLGIDGKPEAVGVLPVELANSLKDVDVESLTPGEEVLSCLPVECNVESGLTTFDCVRIPGDDDDTEAVKETCECTIDEKQRRDCALEAGRVDEGSTALVPENHCENPELNVQFLCLGFGQESRKRQQTTVDHRQKSSHSHHKESTHEIYRHSTVTRSTRKKHRGCKHRRHHHHRRGGGAKVNVTVHVGSGNAGIGIAGQGGGEGQLGDAERPSRAESPQRGEPPKREKSPKGEKYPKEEKEKYPKEEKEKYSKEEKEKKEKEDKEKKEKYPKEKKEKYSKDEKKGKGEKGGADAEGEDEETLREAFDEVDLYYDPSSDSDCDEVIYLCECVSKTGYYPDENVDVEEEGVGDKEEDRVPDKEEEKVDEAEKDEKKEKKDKAEKRKEKKEKRS